MNILLLSWYSGRILNRPVSQPNMIPFLRCWFFMLPGCFSEQMPPRPKFR